MARSTAPRCVLRTVCLAVLLLLQLTRSSTVTARKLSPKSHLSIAADGFHFPFRQLGGVTALIHGSRSLREHSDCNRRGNRSVGTAAAAAAAASLTSHLRIYDRTRMKRAHNDVSRINAACGRRDRLSSPSLAAGHTRSSALVYDTKN